MKNRFATCLNFAIITLFSMNLTVISPLLESIRKDYSLSIAQSGLIFTFNFIGFVIFVLIGGVLADRQGKKPVLLFALAGFTLTLFVFAISPNFVSLCAVMFLVGGFGGVMESMTLALVSDLNPQNPSFYVNLAMVFFGAGAVVGPVLAGFAVSSGLGWRLCYDVLGAIGLVLTVILAASRMPKAAAGSGFSLQNLKYCFSDKRFLAICLCVVFYTGSEVGGWGWMCTMLKQEFGFGVSEASLAVAVFWIAMTVGRFLCGPLTSRFSLRSLIIFLAFSSAAITLLPSFVNSKAVIWVIVAAMGLTYSSLYPFIVSCGSRRTRATTGTSISLLVASGGIGSMIIPYLMGALGGVTTMGLAMLLPAALLGVIGIIFALARVDGKNSAA